MTDERLYELMGWPDDMKIEPGSMAHRIRALVVTAERDEREACAETADCFVTGGMEIARAIRARHNAPLGRALVTTER